MRLSQIAKEFGLELVGEDKEIRALNALQEAKGDELSFLQNRKYLKALKDTKAAAVIVQEEFVKELPKGVSALISQEPYVALAKISKLFAKEPMQREGKEPIIGKGCKIAD